MSKHETFGGPQTVVEDNIGDEILPSYVGIFS